MPQLKKNAPKSAKKKRVHEELSKFKEGTLQSSSGEKVKDRKQAIAIAMSESGQSKSRKMDKKPKGDATTEKAVVKKARKDGDRRKRNKGRS